MKVSLIDYTGYGTTDPARRAANVLLFTKSTRLNMSPGLMSEIESWSSEKVKKELEYMSNTIPSSWEFVDFTFLIEEVTRAFTHQLVRTRNASYAQQTMRILDVGEFKYLTGPSIVGKNRDRYDETMEEINSDYKDLIHNGAAIEDARGILPTNILTNICMKINMRNFIDLAHKRSGKRTQDEYRRVLDSMTIEVQKIYPWFYMFSKKSAIDVSVELENLISENFKDDKAKIQAYKLIDKMRKEL